MFVVIQSCSVDPIPEKDVVSKFDGKNVLESIVRYVNLKTKISSSILQDNLLLNMIE